MNQEEEMRNEWQLRRFCFAAIRKMRRRCRRVALRLPSLRTHPSFFSPFTPFRWTTLCATLSATRGLIFPPGPHPPLICPRRSFSFPPQRKEKINLFHLFIPNFLFNNISIENSIMAKV